MAYTAVALFGYIALIFAAAALFVNAIEWIGSRLHLGSTFVGTILSPLFTSFPELTIFLVAVFAYKGKAGQEIGLGTLFGQPFMASSLSYGLVGAAVLMGYLLKKRNNTVLVVDKALAIPYIFITVLFPLTLVPASLSVGLVKHLFGFLFLGAFIFYIWLMSKRRTAEQIENRVDLYFHKVAPKSVWGKVAGAVAQLVISIFLLYIGSHKMVKSVDILAQGIGISPMGLALIAMPAATAIPETASALIWGYQGKDTLSIGSLVGEKILYSTFYPALGLFFTPWILDLHSYTSVIATTIISLILLYYILKQRLPWYALCFGLVFFIMYALMIFVFRV